MKKYQIGALTVANTVAIDWAGVGSTKTKECARSVFQGLGASPVLKEGSWERIVCRQSGAAARNLIVLTDLSTCALRFQSVKVHQWTAAVRATNAYFVVLVRNLRDQKYASLVDDIVQATSNRIVVHSVGKMEAKVLESSLRHALLAIDPESITDARYSEDTDSIWLEFGDGKRAILPWASLALGNVKPKLDPQTVRPSDDLATVQLVREDGSIFDIDSTLLRSAFDERLAEKLNSDAHGSAEELGRRLRTRRKLRRFTQSELAHRSRLDQGLISKLEQGKQRPGFTTLTKYARGLGLSVSELLA
jgi:DNA-binding XRE family transcriptional regulator